MWNRDVTERKERKYQEKEDNNCEYKQGEPFGAEVLIDGNTEQVHVKNTGRLQELLVPKAKVTLQKVLDPNRRSGNSENNIRKQQFDHLPGRTH